jgi:hypothetical protein
MDNKGSKILAGVRKSCNDRLPEENSMPNLPYYNSLKIFLASPSDVNKERQLAEEVINAVDTSCRDILGLRTECLSWNKLPPLTPLRGQGDIQEVIIKEMVLKCNIFVLIFNKRYGSISPGYSKSNTEREIETVLNIIEEGRNVTLLSYFKDTPPDPDMGEQEKKLEELKERLTKRNLFYHTYKTAEDFRNEFTHDLYYVAMKFALSTTKQKALRYFWRLGTAESQGNPKVAIIYPPMDRSYIKGEKPDHIWWERLVPPIIFEDFKAIDKIEKTLRFVGHHEITTFPTDNISEEICDMNRVWLCLPRNARAIEQLQQYESIARFKVIPRSGTTPATFLWKPDNQADFITVQSPLGKYLEFQRAPHPGGEWRQENARIIAKDYAIIARFTDRTERKPTVDGTLKDFFLAGIRGLGTWGAGWFVDRKYKAFLEYENINEDIPIQLLLEVTYKNDYIYDVKDVSNQPPDYFEKENDIDTIKQIISKNH